MHISLNCACKATFSLFRKSKSFYSFIESINHDRFSTYANIPIFCIWLLKCVYKSFLKFSLFCDYCELCSTNSTNREGAPLHVLSGSKLPMPGSVNCSYKLSSNFQSLDVIVKNWLQKKRRLQHIKLIFNKVSVYSSLDISIRHKSLKSFKSNHY